MAVYPFYIESIAEGKATSISGGCRKKEGSQRTVIFQRDNGGIITAFTVEQNSYKCDDGRILLVCSVYDGDGEKIATKETYY